MLSVMFHVSIIVVCVAKSCSGNYITVSRDRVTSDELYSNFGGF